MEKSNKKKEFRHNELEWASEWERKQNLGNEYGFNFGASTRCFDPDMLDKKKNKVNYKYLDQLK